MDKLVSIIIPVYNVGEFIEKCAHSLFGQTYYNIEYIIVDDESPDNSIQLVKAVLEQYPKRKNQVQFLRHEQNKGLPAARNTGLALAKGEYIFHCDSDDWIERNMIEEMLEKAIENEAEIVYCDFFLTFSSNERYMKQSAYSNSLHCIQAMLQGGMKYNVWNKLIKRSLYTDNQIQFPSGKGMGEDMCIIKLFAHAKNVVYLPKAYYHYIQTNTNAFTKSYSQKSLDDMLYNAKDIVAYLSNIYRYSELERDFHYFKLNLKLPFLITLDKKMYSLWRAWFPDSNQFIASNPSFSSRIKLLQYAAEKKQDWIVWAYNRFILKIIYGIIYK